VRPSSEGAIAVIQEQAEQLAEEPRKTLKGQEGVKKLAMAHKQLLLLID
jgi:hypothetical protein